MITKLNPINKIRILLFFFSTLLSLSSCYYFFQLKIINLYGDGVAHLNIARKLIDLSENNLWQHYVQLGSPWLPLPHFLAIPFVFNNYLWQKGLAGSFISMICYVISTQLLFEIGYIFGSLYLKTEKNLLSGLLAALIFSLNPSVLYLQSTPMTELTFLATFLGGVFFLVKYSSDNTNKYLVLSAIIACLSMLTRYEAWAILPSGFITIFLVTQGTFKYRLKRAILWALISFCAVLYWLWHNWAIYGNALEFYNGFHSAKGIYLRQKERLGWASFTIGQPHLAFLLAFSASIACSGWVCLLGLISFIKALFVIYKEKNKELLIKLFPMFLLTIPFLFTVYSLFTGNIQIYSLSAISLLNVRYGLNIILAISIFPIIFLSPEKKLKNLIVFLLIISNYIWLVSDGVLQLAIVQEPYRNNFNSRETRAKAKLVKYLLEHPPKKQIMIYAGDLASVIPDSKMEFRDLVFEGLSSWHSKEIPQNVNTVIVKEGDELWKKLEKVDNFSTAFQLVYEIYPNPRIMVWQRKNEKK
ncbi:MAG: glycosyltransferase family 39 protein [Acidobacteria bacterium]|nr:glycosyltransferase family 39 protein [Acidobacteriota bacterium]